MLRMTIKETLTSTNRIQAEDFYRIGEDDITFYIGPFDGNIDDDLIDRVSANIGIR